MAFSVRQAQYLDHIFSQQHVQEKIREAKSALNKIIGSLLAERKRVFLNKVNDLHTKNPYSYAFRKELCSSSVVGIVKNDYNTTITNHFKDMFNTRQELTKTLPDIPRNKVVKNWRFKDITCKELKAIIGKTKNSMSGYDNISVPLLKVLDKPSLNLIAKAISLAMSESDVPAELGVGILLPLPKTPTPSKLSDYRPIVVLSTLYRLFSSVVNIQFMDILERAKIIHPAQRGFMKKGSTMDHLVTLRTAMSSKISEKQQIFAMALDIKNAYGSVIHDRLISILRKHGFHTSVTNLVKAMLSNSVIKVLVNRHLSSPFTAGLGVPQGDPSSPAWFNVYINSSTNISSSYNGITVHGIRIHMLLYADDILLVADSAKDMQKAINNLKRELRRLGLASMHFNDFSGKTSITPWV